LDSQGRRDNDSDSVAVDLSEEDALPVLRGGDIIGGAQLPGSSNYAFLVRIDAGPGRHLLSVYKPRDGERPLHDFPSGSLYKREHAAYLLSRSLGWPAVPLTLIRDGPYGVGSFQRYVRSGPQQTYFNLIGGHAGELLPFAVFDLVANNADRKAGHCLLGDDGRIWSVDHGLTFHREFKLRTVMLEFWGSPVPQPLLNDLDALRGRLGSHTQIAADLTELLSEEESNALLQRVESVLKAPRIPELDPRWNVPWQLE
jgi:uncharacterized repeat protein (TIGR03843 family)